MRDHSEEYIVTIKIIGNPNLAPLKPFIEEIIAQDLKAGEKEIMFCFPLVILNNSTIEIGNKFVEHILLGYTEILYLKDSHVKGSLSLDLSIESSLLSDLHYNNTIEEYNLS